jgi:hypothetical protein
MIVMMLMIMLVMVMMMMMMMLISTNAHVALVTNASPCAGSTCRTG